MRVGLKVEGREGLSVSAPHARMAKLETLTNPLLSLAEGPVVAALKTPEAAQ